MANGLPFRYGAVVKVTTIRGREYQGKIACIFGDFLILKEEYRYEGEEGSRTGLKEHHVRISQIESSQYLCRWDLRQMKPLDEETRRNLGISEKLTEYNSAGLCLGDGCSIRTAITSEFFNQGK